MIPSILMLIVGLVVGASLTFILLEKRRREVNELEQAQQNSSRELTSKGVDLQSRESILAQQLHALQQNHTTLNAQIISFNERIAENYSLKKELQALYQRWRKTSSENIQLEQSQRTLDANRQILGHRFLKDNLAWISASLNANNYANKKNQLKEVISQLASIGIVISTEEAKSLYFELEERYKLAIRVALDREEQSRISAAIREEQKREREIKQEVERIERERALVEHALTKALSKAQGAHSAEIAALEAKLAEVERKERAISQAQLTKAGNVYVISNLGSFGEDIFKIGMTRRLEPMNRVIELGDASVPFPFDVHMMIATDNAPTLENVLHQKFHHKRINKVNPRKEFFRVTLEEIVAEVENQHGKVVYQVDAEALQYRNSLQMTDEDVALVEQIFDTELQNAGIDEE